MSKKEIDRYLSAVPEPQHSTLQALRKAILAAVPTAEECISYGVPAFRINRDVIAGFASAKNHCSYFPFSGQVVDDMKNDLAKYDTSRGTIRFEIHKSLPTSLVRKLIKARLRISTKKAMKRSGTSVKETKFAGISKKSPKVKNRRT